MAATNVLDRVDDQTRRLGVVRYHDGRVIGGVCRGIGARLDLDPVLIRVVFALVALAGGIGVALYLVAWAALPDDDGVVPLRRAVEDHDGTSIALCVGAGVATITGLAGLAGERGVTHLWGLAAVALLIWLFVRRDAQGRTPGAGQPDHSEPGATAPTGTVDAQHAAGAPATAHPPMPVITAWGGRPVGPFETSNRASVPAAGPAAVPSPGGTWSGSGGSWSADGTWSATAATWSPERTWEAPGAAAPVTTAVAPVYAPKPRRRRLGWPLWLVAIGLAALAHAGGQALAHSRGLSPWAASSLGLAGAAGALALVVVLAGLRGRRTAGLTVLMVLATLMAVGGTAGSPYAPPTGSTFGDVAWTPASAAELRTSYDVSAGDAALDLTRLRATDLRGTTLAVHVGAGEMRVRVPADVPVLVRVQVGFGEARLVEAGNTRQSIAGSGESGEMRAGGDDNPLVIDATVGLGSLRVERTSR